MSDTKFTRGPWRIASQKFVSGFYVIHANDQSADREVQVVKIDYGSHPDNGYLMKAFYNAKLIAAAPELLEALQYLVSVKNHKEAFGKDAEYLKSQPIAWGKAIEAIKKATE